MFRVRSGSRPGDAQEKEFTRQRDQLSQALRQLPWECVEKNYVFDTPSGRKTLAELFDGRSQLVVYHFMFGPDWETPCKSCSFWADNIERNVVHLNARDVSVAAISRASLARLEAVKQRMGWTFTWASSGETDFNFDFGVSFRPDQKDATYNYAPKTSASTEQPGISVFYKDQSGSIFHTYSCYARGLDMMNAAYQYLDLVPRGRDEAGLAHTMVWCAFVTAMAAKQGVACRELQEYDRQAHRLSPADRRAAGQDARRAG